MEDLRDELCERRRAARTLTAAQEQWAQQVELLLDTVKSLLRPLTDDQLLVWREARFYADWRGRVCESTHDGWAAGWLPGLRFFVTTEPSRVYLLRPAAADPYADVVCEGETPDGPHERSSCLFMFTDGSGGVHWHVKVNPCGARDSGPLTEATFAEMLKYLMHAPA